MKGKSDHTEREKCLAFDRLYDMALTHADNQMNDVRDEDGDELHCIYEEVMQLCLGNDIFDEIRKRRTVE